MTQKAYYEQRGQQAFSDTGLHFRSGGIVEIKDMADYLALRQQFPNAQFEEVTDRMLQQPQFSNIAAPGFDRALVFVGGVGFQPGKIYRIAQPIGQDGGKNENTPGVISGGWYTNNAGLAIPAGTIETINATLLRNGRTGAITNGGGAGDAIFVQYRENQWQAYQPAFAVDGGETQPLDTLSIYDLFITSLLALGVAYRLVVH